LANAKNPYGQVLWQEAEPAARALGLEPILFQLQELGDLPATFRGMEGKEANALIVFFQQCAAADCCTRSRTSSAGDL
jgi:hypothetical protein